MNYKIIKFYFSCIVTSFCISFFLVYYFSYIKINPTTVFESGNISYNGDKVAHFRTIKKRRDSLPFVTGDAFRIFADFVFDEIERSIPSPYNMEDNKVIFLKTDYLRQFFKEYFPKFKKKFILITHNSDHPIEINYKQYLENNLITAWFAQNPLFEHQKLIPIPIGFNNAHHSKINNDVLLKTQNSKLKPWNERKILLYLNYNSGTNKQARQKYLKLFENINGVIIAKNRVDFSTYLAKLGDSKFVLCPRGNGLDTHRFYETILMGAIPIVESSALNQIYKQGTVLVLPSLSNLTEHMLTHPQNYIKNMNFSKDIVYMKTWLNKINSYRSNI